VDRSEGLVPQIAAPALRALAQQDLAALAAVAASSLRGRDDVVRHRLDRRRRAWRLPVGENLKATTPPDLRVAELALAERIG